MSRGTAIDLFAGAGGATQGLKDASFAVLAAVESDPVAAMSYRANHSNVELLEKDIRHVEPDEVRTGIGLERAELTLLKACPP